MPATATQLLLKERIDAALDANDLEATVERIRSLLEEGIRNGAIALPDRYRVPAGDHYARRLLIRERDYSAVVMTWGPGQQTALHDHAGLWCVEGVVEGEIVVIRHDLKEESAGLFRFEEQTPIRAARGSAGSLIPPVEYHVLANPTDRVAVTLHIYGGEIDRCNIFVPHHDSWRERQTRMLGYDD